MKLVIASSNQGKIKEIKEILGDYFEEIVSMKDVGLHLEIEETGETFCENAQIKALAVYSATGMCALSDDSGLAVEALGGAPGVYSARYSGEGANDKKNNEKLLAALEGVPYPRRSAAFVCCVALVRPDLPTLFAQGECSGIIGLQEKGENGFGYDPLFYVPQLDKTFAQIDNEVKNSMSHRSRALQKLKEMLEQEKQI